MVFAGSCACGELKYKVDAEPITKALCHCNNCQKLTGSAYTTNILIPTTSFIITAGTPKHYTFVQEPSKIPFETLFCGTCGVRLTKATEDAAFKGVLILQAGTVDEGFEYGKPDVELWTTMRKAYLAPVEEAAQAKTFA